jgi:hypothetical protein
VLALRDGSTQFFGTIDQARAATNRPAGPEALGSAEAQAS